MNGKESWVGTPQRGHETETPRRCSAFRITEGGVIEHFRVDGVGGLLNAAEYVQSYQQEKGALQLLSVHLDADGYLSHDFLLVTSVIGD